METLDIKTKLSAPSPLSHALYIHLVVTLHHISKSTCERFALKWS